MLTLVVNGFVADFDALVLAEDQPVAEDTALAGDGTVAESDQPYEVMICPEWVTGPWDEQPRDEQLIDGGLPEDWVPEAWMTEEWMPMTGEPDPMPEWLEGDASILDGRTVWVWNTVDDEQADQDSVQPDGWIRCGTHLVMQGLGNYLVGQYREFVEQNPTWPEEHGAGGIQLMVITPSKLCRWAQLSTPGEAQSFDAWYEQVFLNNAPVDPQPPIDDGPVTVPDDNLFSPDLNSDLPVPVAAPTGGSDSTPKPAGTAAMSVADAAWAGLFTSQANDESTGSTPVGGRRRSR
ncbi:MAG: hypothetical protein ACKOB1_04390 [Planctomycetia bacterium]